MNKQERGMAPHRKMQEKSNTSPEEIRIDIPLPPPPSGDNKDLSKQKRGVETSKINRDDRPTDPRDKFSTDNFTIDI